MKKIITLTVLLIAFFSAYTQTSRDTNVHDPAAKKILDKLSEKNAKYQTMRIAFKYTIDNKAEKVKDSYSGFLFVKGDKYKLMIPGTEIFSDGKYVWTYIKEDEEITKVDVDPEDQSALNPKNIFTIYKSGFKYRLRGEANEKFTVKSGGKLKTVTKNVYVIDLYPENPKKTKYSIIRLKIDKKQMQIVSIKYQGKDGTDFIIDVQEFKPNVKLIDSMFAYDAKRYPGVELIDATE